jgi:methyl coenzyme M reductase alpha subunit
MTDNIDVSPSTTEGRVQVATDEVSGVHYPVYKMAVGADGEANPVSITAPLHVGGDAFNMLCSLLSDVIEEQKLTNELLKDIGK